MADVILEVVGFSLTDPPPPAQTPCISPGCRIDISDHKVIIPSAHPTDLQLEEVVILDVRIELSDGSGQMIQVVLAKKPSIPTTPRKETTTYSVGSRGPLAGEDTPCECI